MKAGEVVLLTRDEPVYRRWWQLWLPRILRYETVTYEFRAEDGEATVA